MKKLNLFTHYEPETLFLKAKKQIRDQIEQWSDSNLDDSCILSLKECVRLSLPEVDFVDGREILTERIFPLSDIRPGAKVSANVRMKVLGFKYEVKGQMFLLGCRPHGDVPEPAGEWFADPLENAIYLEYKWYERNPRKVLAAHREYMRNVLHSYSNLQLELDGLVTRINNLVDEAVSAKRLEADRRSQLLSILKL